MRVRRRKILWIPDKKQNLNSSHYSYKEPEEWVTTRTISGWILCVLVSFSFDLLTKQSFDWEFRVRFRTSVYLADRFGFRADLNAVISHYILQRGQSSSSHTQLSQQLTMCVCSECVFRPSSRCSAQFHLSVGADRDFVGNYTVNRKKMEIRCWGAADNLDWI